MSDEKKPDCCPHCGSDDIRSAGYRNGVGHTTLTEIRCLACGADLLAEMRELAAKGRT